MVDHAKKAAGERAADYVKPGMRIGIGSGSTVYWFIQELGKRVSQGLEVTGVATSTATAKLARQAGITLTELDAVGELALDVDGADEIDSFGNLIKGGGGALLEEKIVAAASATLIIVADNSKLVKQLGKFPLPVEVIPFGYRHVEHQILKMGICGKISLRKKNEAVFETDQHHYILDCHFEDIQSARELNTALHLIPGGVETGLFPRMATRALVGFEDGKVEILDFK
jgi:ribose 5-phosphate isomerase A